MRTSRAAALGVAALLASCSDPGPDLLGRVQVAPCSFGPDAAACTHEVIDPTCVEQYGEPRGEASASVSLPQAERVASTNADGVFRFARLAPGTYAVSAVVPNTVEGRRAEVVELTASSDGTDLELTFVAAGTIEGRVLPPPEAQPGDNTEHVGGIDQVEVQMACPPRTAITDAEGRFRFTGVPQGERRLTAVGLGLVGAAAPAQVYRGRITAVEIPLAYGRPPDAPNNRPPQLTQALQVTPLPPQTSQRVVLRPATDGHVRGDIVALSCAATDPDGDPLQYVWSASSGDLQAGSGPSAVLKLGSTDAGVACTILDGRGGVVGSDALISVFDPYYGGATLVSGGAVFAAAYGQDFDLVAWSPTDAVRIPAPGPQWRPSGDGTSIAFFDRNNAVDSLWWTPGTNVTPVLIATDVRGAAAYDGGVAWVDPSGAAHVRLLNGTVQHLGGGYDGDIATAGRDLALGREGGDVELVHVDAAGALSVGTRVTPGRTRGRLATDGTRVAYWALGRPALEGPSGVQPLGPDEIPLAQVGRVVLDGDRAAYSFHASPLNFVEATVVPLSGDTPGEPVRVALGPSEVLDLDGDRLLLGRPRAEESEPSADLWIVDLAQLGSLP